MFENINPLVSVLMPAYNASHTIHLALASLLAQSYQNWECIIVDDGSTDQTVELIQEISDSRIKLTLLDKNYGRGIARQKALDLASGKYITMLDSDDWLYPDKIAVQVCFLENNAEISLHSMAMAIVDIDMLASVRRASENIDRTLNDLHGIFIPHAPSMIRRSDMESIKYDARFKLAQDQDFLRRLLIGKRYVVSMDVGYCYSEMQSVSFIKIVKGYFYNSFGYLKLLRYFKSQALFYSSIEIIKIPYSIFRYIFLGQKYIIKSRSLKPSRKDKQDFEWALKIVKDKLKDIELNEKR